MPRPRITVVGSLNIDYIASVERLPIAGQTVPATHLIRRFGGKGANQALAAARQGAAVTLIGCVGRDEEGQTYRKLLRPEGVSTAGILTSKSALSGMAMIAVDEQAENIIIVAAGANGKLTSNMVRGRSRF